MDAFGQAHAEVNFPNETDKNDMTKQFHRNACGNVTRVLGPNTPSHQTVKIRPLDRLPFSTLLALKSLEIVYGKERHSDD